MKIGVDATCWANGRGYGRFTRELLRAMVAIAPEHAFTFYVDPPSFEQMDLQSSNLSVERIEITEGVSQAASANGSRRVRDMLRMTRAVSRDRPDVFFSPSVYSFFPLPARQRAVVAIHDVIAEQFPGLTLPSAKSRLFWRMKVGLALRQAELILTVSEFSARGISEFLDVSPDRIRVASEAPSAIYSPSAEGDIRRAAETLELPRGARWFIYVGGFNPHKRVQALVRSHAAVVREQGEGAPYLLLVGDPGRDSFHQDVREIRELVTELGTAERVVWTGFVPDEALRHLHSGAIALALPSVAEGFGLPAVEAAACGTPVVATTESPLPTLLRGGGIFVAPGDDDTLTGALRLLSRDQALRDEMGRRARSRAAELTWDAGAEAALAAIDEAAA